VALRTTIRVYAPGASGGFATWPRNKATTVAPVDEDAALEDDTLADDADGDEAADDGDGQEVAATALDELEAEELEMLTEDESTEAIVVDEAAEMRAIRRAEIAMEGEAATEATAGEFVCESCFLVLKSSQRAPGRRKICKDCAA
jgi:hypothetical protein